MHKVSVIIPIYNVEDYLPKCLESVINQTYKNLEIICVDDCSPDNSSQILKEYENKDKRIKIVNRKQNGGLSAARNSGMDVATGEYIYFLDSDDWIDLDYIEKMVQAMEESEAEIVLNTNVISHKGEVLGRHIVDKTYNDISHQFIDAKEAILNITWNTWAHLWKKSFLDRTKVRFPEGYIIEDQYFQAITYIYVNKIYVIRDSAYHYLIRSDSIVGQKRSDSFEINLKILNKIIDYYEENNLKNNLNIRVMTPWIIPACNCIEQYRNLRKYFLRVKDMVNLNRKLYSNVELKLFDTTLDNIDEAVNTNYGKLALFEKLHANIKREQKFAHQDL